MDLDRDYALEMRTLTNSFCVGEWSAPAVAAKVVKHCRDKDPALLAGWLDLQAVGIVRDMINATDRSTRSYNRATAGRSVFREAAARFEQGDPEPLRTTFLDESYTIKDGSKAPLRNLRAEDLRYVADGLRHQAESLAMRAAFLRALAAKCEAQPVGKIFSELELATMWNSLAGAATPIAIAIN